LEISSDKTRYCGYCDYPGYFFQLKQIIIHELNADELVQMISLHNNFFIFRLKITKIPSSRD
ncbi:11264_t:CDS:2, partial [Rhizophagus irregularis]